MAIWHPAYGEDASLILEQVGALARNTADQHLGIAITELGEDFLRGTVPVDQRTMQPFGLLHGGVSVVLAESLGSIGGNLCVDPEKSYCVGIEVSASHLRSARSGLVTGTARPLRIGRKTQTWQIELRDQQERLTCMARLTLAVVSRRDDGGKK